MGRLAAVPLSRVDQISETTEEVEEIAGFGEGRESVTGLPAVPLRPNPSQGNDKNLGRSPLPARTR